METLVLEIDGKIKKKDSVISLIGGINITLLPGGGNVISPSVSEIPIQDPKGDVILRVLGLGRKNNHESGIYYILVPHIFLARFVIAPITVTAKEISLAQYVDDSCYLKMTPDLGTKCREGLLVRNVHAEMKAIHNSNDFETSFVCQNNFKEEIVFKLVNVDLNTLRIVRVRSSLSLEDFVLKVQESFQEIADERERLIQVDEKDKR